MTWTGEPCGEESPTCTGEQKVSEKANQRYWEALSQVDDSTRLEELIQPLEQPRLWRESEYVRCIRLRPRITGCWNPSIGASSPIHGVRNRDLQQWLYDTPVKIKVVAHRRSAAVSRKLRLLRAHGLIQKIPHTHRYQVTKSGRLIILAVLTIQRTSLAQLNLPVPA
jgi:hypothetical protein